MKKKLQLIGVLLLLIMFGLSNVVTAQNLALNNGFENWTANGASGPADDWTLSGSSMTGAQEAVTVRTGNFSTNITWTTTSTRYLQQFVAVTGGTDYNFSFWVLDNDPNGKARIALRWYDAGGSFVSGYYGDYTSDSPSWQELTSGMQTAPATATEAHLEIRVYDVSWSGTATVYVDDVEFVAAAAGGVEAPAFNPVAGTYFSAQDVTITSATAGADIYYTIDGTDPDNTSTLYAAPVHIAATTTLKAIAIKAGMTDSSITSGTYNITTPVAIADLATLRTQAQDGTIYQLNSEALLTYQQSYRHQKYIQDGTAGILIDDSPGKMSTIYSVGDGITGIIGTLGSYKGMLQFKPSTDAGAATSTGNTITPVLISATEFVTNFENYEAQLVRVDNLTFADAGATFANGNVYATTDPSANALDFRTSFYSVDYIGTTIPTGGRDIIGIANDRNNPYLTARNAADILNHAPVIPLGSTGIMIAGLLMAIVILVRKGRFF